MKLSAFLFPKTKVCPFNQIYMALCARCFLQWYQAFYASNLYAFALVKDTHVSCEHTEILYPSESHVSSEENPLPL